MTRDCSFVSIGLVEFGIKKSGAKKANLKTNF